WARSRTRSAVSSVPEKPRRNTASMDLRQGELPTNGWKLHGKRTTPCAGVLARRPRLVGRFGRLIFKLGQGIRLIGAGNLRNLEFQRPQVLWRYSWATSAS